MTTRLRVLMVSGTFLLVTSLWAQTAQVNSSVDGQASVQAAKTGAQVSSEASSSSSVSTRPNRANAGLSSGTSLNAALVTPVDSRKMKPGDEITARTTENVRAEGKTVLPKGTKLVGYVARASSRAKGDTESALSLTFERAVLSNGQELPLNLSIQALASAQSVVSAGGE